MIFMNWNFYKNRHYLYEKPAADSEPAAPKSTVKIVAGCGGAAIVDHKWVLLHWSSHHHTYMPAFPAFCPPSSCLYQRGWWDREGRLSMNKQGPFLVETLPRDSTKLIILDWAGGTWKVAYPWISKAHSVSKHSPGSPSSQSSTNRLMGLGGQPSMQKGPWDSSVPVQPLQIHTASVNFPGTSNWQAMCWRS